MLRLYDTMTKKVTPIQPLEPGLVKMYTCGPTVYRDAHIGNLRSYLMADWIRRVLEAEGISVTHVKNITDVGHMRQEVLEQGRGQSHCGRPCFRQDSPGDSAALHGPLHLRRAEAKDYPR